MSETTSTRNTKGMQTVILCTLNTLMFRTRKRAIVMTKGILVLGNIPSEKSSFF